MKKIAALFFCLGLACGCNDPKAKEFFYTDVYPDKAITSLIPFPWGINDLKENNIYFWSRDGYEEKVEYASAMYGVDLNHDSHWELSFEIRHRFQVEVMEQTYDEFEMFLDLPSTCEVSLADISDGSVKRYALGDALDYQSFGKILFDQSDRGAGYLIRINHDNNFTYDGELYIAVKMMIKNQPHYGWLLVETDADTFTFTIKEYALCAVAGKHIVIGQRD